MFLKEEQKVFENKLMGNEIQLEVLEEKLKVLENKLQSYKNSSEKALKAIDEQQLKQEKKQMANLNNEFAATLKAFQV